jgi:hypothetical protein
MGDDDAINVSKEKKFLVVKYKRNDDKLGLIFASIVNGKK